MSYVLSLFLLLPLLVHAAEPVSIKFSRAPLELVARVIYRDALGLSVTLDDAAITSSKLLTVDLDKVAPHNLRVLADAAMRSHGLDVVQLGDVVHVTTPKPVDADKAQAPLPPPITHVYSPRHLPAVDLAAYLALPAPPAESSRLVIKGQPSEVLDHLRALEALDIAPQRHRIVGRLFELVEDRAQGVSLSAVLRLLGERVRIGVGDPVSSTLTLAGSALDVFLRLVHEDGRFRQISDQVVSVEDGQPARFQAGADVPIRGQVVTQQGGATSQGVEYRPTGLVLDVRAHGFGESIRVALKLESSGVSRTTTSGIDSPTITRRDLSTVARLKPGESLIVGGLDQTSDSRSHGLLSSSSDSLSSRLLLILTVDPG